MVGIITRQYSSTNELKLSVRIKTGTINTAIALSITVDAYKWSEISQSLKSLKKAYKRGASIFIEDSLTKQLWDILRQCMVLEATGAMTIDKVYNIISGIMFKDDIKDVIDNTSAMEFLQEKTRKPVAKPTLIQYLNTFINIIAEGKKFKPGTTKTVAPKTANTYKSVLYNIEAFGKKNKRVIDWDDMTMDFLEEWKMFMINKHLSPNTISSYVRSLKHVLDCAKENGYTTTTDFQNKSFKSKNVPSDSIALTEQQIMQLYNADLQNVDSILLRLKRDKNVTKEEIKMLQKDWLSHPRLMRSLDVVRDAFVLGCMVGQRFSDYKKIKASMLEEINNWQFIHLTQQKGEKEVYIPYNAIIGEIVRKYKDGFPFISNIGLFNTKIRIICLLAGLTEKCDITLLKGNFKYISYNRICDLTSSHTARRTFATNAYKRGVPLSSIMTVTGHTTESMLRKYLRINNQEKAVLAASDFQKIPMMLMTISKKAE